jgi:hypothetical protein
LDDRNWAGTPGVHSIRTLGRWGTLVGLFLAVSYLCQIALISVNELADQRPLTLGMLRTDPLDWPSIKLMVPLLGVVVLLEFMMVGWRASSFRRLFFVPDPSARADWAFLLLLVTGLYGALIALSGFALFHYADPAAYGWKGLDLFRHWPLWAIIAALFISGEAFSLIGCTGLSTHRGFGHCTRCITPRMNSLRSTIYVVIA